MARKTKKKSLIEKAADAFDHAIHPNHESEADESNDEEFEDEENESTEPLSQEKTSEILDKVSEEQNEKPKTNPKLKKIPGKYHKFQKGN